VHGVLDDLEHRGDPASWGAGGPPLNLSGDPAHGKGMIAQGASRRRRVEALGPRQLAKMYFHRLVAFGGKGWGLGRGHRGSGRTGKKILSNVGGPG